MGPKRQEEGKEVIQRCLRIHPPFLPAISGNYHLRPLFPPINAMFITLQGEKQLKNVLEFDRVFYFVVRKKSFPFCFMFPAEISAASPSPQNRSTLAGPRMAPPVS